MFLIPWNVYPIIHFNFYVVNTSLTLRGDLITVKNCNMFREAFRRKGGDGNESTTGRKKGRPNRRRLDRLRDAIKGRGLSTVEV